MIADAPPITAGVFAKSPMAKPDRLVAWNAMVGSWTEHSPSVQRLPIADEIVALERTAGHSLRPDGVHLDVEGAADVVRDVVLPAVVAGTGPTAQPLTRLRPARDVTWRD